MTRNAFAIAAVVVAALAAAQCGGAATAPTAAVSMVSGVTLSAPNVIVGGAGQGTVTLSGRRAAGGASIALSSSNPAVATVPTTATIPAGSSSVSFTITAIAPGTATFVASINGSSSQSPTFTVGPRAVALASLTLARSTVVGGDSVTATATLTGAAPAGGASVSLTGSDPASVPASVTVLTGFSSATFTVQTRAVGGTIAATVAGAYGGVSASTVLSITRPTVATASFGVTGPTESDTCALTNAGATLNCTFNGSTSSAPGTIVAWDWSYTVGTTLSQTTTGAVLTQAAVNCSWLPPPPLAGGHDVAAADRDAHGPRQPGERQRQGGQRRCAALRERRVRLLRVHRRIGRGRGRQFCNALQG